MSRNIFVLALVNLLLVDNASGATIDNSNSENNKHTKMIPKLVKKLAQNASGQEELIETHTTQLDDQCLALEKWKERTRQTENLYDPRPDHESGVLKILAVSQSSTYVRGDAYHAIDLKTGTIWDRFECAHTGDGDNNPWWEAKFAYYSTVNVVALTGRGGCCAERLGNFEIKGWDKDPRTYPDQTPKICTENTETFPAGTTEVFYCNNPIQARYLRVVSKVPYLSLCGFQAKGTPVFDKSTLTSTTQSSTHPSEIPSGAWRPLLPYHESCSLTDPDEDGDPWWQMKFEQMTTVVSVTITNRDDDKFEWLKGLVVAVYENRPTACKEKEVAHTCVSRDEVIPKGQTVTLPCDEKVKGLYLRITKTRIQGQALSFCGFAVTTE